MSATRIYNDPARIEKQVEEWTYVGRYQLNVPGPGASLPFQEDVQLRLQEWGANQRTDAVDIESELIGVSQYNRGVASKDVGDRPKNTAINASKTVRYSNTQPFVEESRASHPAWMYRDAVQPRFDYPILNPQANLEKKFHDNIQTRILEKDYYVPRISVGFSSTSQQWKDPTTVDYYTSNGSRV